MANGVKTGGRVKGVPNKMTRAAKDSIAGAAEALGGMDRLVEWVRQDARNEAAFWTSIYPKLLPLQHEGDVGLTITWPVAPARIERT